MASYEIASTAGAEMGTYVGESPAHALAAMHRDAGYRGVHVGADGRIAWPDAETERLCGDVDAWRVREVKS